MSRKPFDIDPVAVSCLAKTYKIDGQILTTELRSIEALYLLRKISADWEPTTKDTRRKLAAMKKSASDLHRNMSEAQPVLHNLMRSLYKDFDSLKDGLVILEQCIATIDAKGWKENGDQVTAGRHRVRMVQKSTQPCCTLSTPKKNPAGRPGFSNRLGRRLSPR